MGQAAHQLEPWAEAWRDSVNDPYLFATGVLGFLPYGVANPEGKDQLEQWQDEFLRDFYIGADGKPVADPRHSVRAGHGVGKGVILAILALWFPLTHYDSKTVVTANSQNQLRDNNWPELKKWAGRLPDGLRSQLQIDEERLFVKAAPEMAFVVRRTASKHNPEALQGIHAMYVLYLIDEASGIPDIVFEVAQGSLSTAGASAVMFSNPTRGTGFFHKTHHQLRHRWRCWRVNCEDVPRARGHIQDVIDTYGKASNKYRVRVLGEFPTADDETVIPLDLVLAAKGREVQRSVVWPIWGLDVARFGDDSIALVKRQGNTLLGLKEWRDLDHQQIAGRVIAEYQATPNDERPAEIIVDVIGMGSGTYDMLRLPGSPVRDRVRACNVAESPAVSEEDHRLRDELWFRGRMWFAARDCHFPESLPDPADAALIEKLIAELTAPTYDFTALGKRIVESKADMKKRGVMSPNLADAFLLSLYGGVHPQEVYRSRTPRASATSWMAA